MAPTPDEPCRREAAALAAVADRLDALADTADLMGDPAGAERWRRDAADVRSRAFALLDR